MFIFNGDTYIDLEVKQLENQWHANHRPIVVGRQVPDTSRFGRLVVEGGRITSFAEKGMGGSGLINAGCYVLGTNALKEFPLNQTFSIETEYLVPEVAKGWVEVFETEGVFIDIGVPEDYARAQHLLTEHQ